MNFLSFKQKIKKLEEENAKLKRMHADLALELDMAKYIIEKKLSSLARNVR